MTLGTRGSQRISEYVSAWHCWSVEDVSLSIAAEIRPVACSDRAFHTGKQKASALVRETSMPVGSARSPSAQMPVVSIRR